MTPRLRLLVLLSALSLLSASLAAQLPRDLDAYITRVMHDFEVPGIAIAIVQDGRVLLAKGYGVRKLGEPTPVDERTLFGIASNTKAFTATALGILVEDGKLRWDAPVIDYLPGFALYDPFVTRELTIRDLLVHRSGLGLGAGDLLWWPTSTYDRKEIARRLRYIKPATSFRSAYAYDNVLYLVAGQVIETVSGQSWEDFVQSRILARVGMTGSTVRHSSAAAAGAGNVATPHERDRHRQVDDRAARLGTPGWRVRTPVLPEHRSRSLVGGDVDPPRDSSRRVGGTQGELRGLRLGIFSARLSWL